MTTQICHSDLNT